MSVSDEFAALWEDPARLLQLEAHGPLATPVRNAAEALRRITCLTRQYFSHKDGEFGGLFREEDGKGGFKGPVKFSLGEACPLCQAMGRGRGPGCEVGRAIVDEQRALSEAWRDPKVPR